jgi:hypothetical protein
MHLEPHCILGSSPEHPSRVASDSGRYRPRSAPQTTCTCLTISSLCGDPSFACYTLQLIRIQPRVKLLRKRLLHKSTGRYRSAPMRLVSFCKTLLDLQYEWRRNSSGMNYMNLLFRTRHPNVK